MVENAEYSSSNNGENYKKFDLYRCIVTLMVAIILAISLALAITLKSFYYVATAFPMVVITSLVLKLSRIRCRKKVDCWVGQMDYWFWSSRLLGLVK